MFNLKFPIIDTLRSQSNNSVKLTEYHLYSSIYESTPRLWFELETSGCLPDNLNMNLGNSFPIQYEISEVESKEGEEGNEEGNATAAAEALANSATGGSSTEKALTGGDLPGMFVAKTETFNVATGTHVRIHCEHDFLAFQEARTRKAYVSKYGKEIIQDIISANTVLKVYEQQLEETDNAATVYRTLGDSDISTIFQEVLPNYSLSGGKPLFFIGLNNKIYFTSANKLMSTAQKAKILVSTAVKGNTVTEATKNNLKANYIEEDTVSELKASEFKLTVGEDNSIFNVKTANYYTSYYAGLTSTSEYIFKPASEKKTYYPIDRIFMSTTNSNNTAVLINRPINNVCYEAKNLFNSYEKLITVRVKILNCGSLKSLIVAGETVTFISPYTYSIYNGNYLVSEVEYGMKGQVAFIEMVLIRPSVDLTWSESLAKDKDQPDFPFALAPTINGADFYNI